MKQWPALRREINDPQKCVICKLATEQDLVCQETEQPGRRKGTALPCSCWARFHQHGKCSKIPKETDCRALMAKPPPAAAANLLPQILSHRALSLLVLSSLSFPPSWNIFLLFQRGLSPSQYPHALCHPGFQRHKDERERSVERRQCCKSSVSSVPASGLYIF